MIKVAGRRSDVHGILPEERCILRTCSSVGYVRLAADDEPIERQGQGRIGSGGLRMLAEYDSPESAFGCVVVQDFVQQIVPRIRLFLAEGMTF